MVARNCSSVVTRHVEGSEGVLWVMMIIRASIFRGDCLFADVCKIDSFYFFSLLLLKAKKAFRCGTCSSLQESF